MKITIEKNERDFDIAAAWRIIGEILSNPKAVIGLSTGQTTINMHKIVSDIYKQYPFDTSKTVFFNVDELTNLPRSYAGCCYTMIRSQLCDALHIPDERFLIPQAISNDFARECSDFEEKIAANGGADLQMLGIGWNGHIGINQPGTPFESETWVSPMDPIFEERVRRETEIGGDVVLGGITRGIKNIMRTRRIILIAKGEHKAEIIKKAVLGPITEDIPASVLQLHPNCEVLADAAAGRYLMK